MRRWLENPRGVLRRSLCAAVALFLGIPRSPLRDFPGGRTGVLPGRRFSVLFAYGAPITFSFVVVVSDEVLVYFLQCVVYIYLEIIQ